MFVSRRKFLRFGAVVSAALVLKPSTLVFGNDSITSNDAVQKNKQTGNQLYTREMFEPLVGDTFRVRAGKQIVDLKLVALTNLKPASEKIGCPDCFSLRFEAVKPLPQATLHTLNHSKLGNFDLFMVQSKSRARFSQTAIVNHVV